MARRSRQLVALLLLALAHAALGAKRSFTLPLHAKNLDSPAPGSRRRLLRNATLPLHGAVKDYGYFYASLYLGTPPKKFAVIVDTGSTMTYVPCATCGAACGPNHQDAAFDPRLSSTSKIIPCDSDKCRCGSPHCACSDAQQCMYTRSYAEQSSSSGILLEDQVSLHDGGAGVPIIFGCETRETGEIFKQRADGLFGLGNSDASVVNQLVAAGEIDDVFSLCFGVVEGDGVLTLGRAPAAEEVPLRYTPLVPSPTHPFYYNVRMDAVSVAGDKLDIAPGVFQEGYATVLDSGTTFTYIPTPAFRAFAAAVESHALERGLLRVRGPDPQYDDICFGGAPEHTDVDALAAVFPSFGLHFANNATLMLGPLNYLFVHTFNSGKYCLGVFDNGHAGTLLGGITFRNVMVQYDRAAGRVGFGPAPCKELGKRHRPPCAAFAAGGNDLAAIVAVADGDCQPEDGGAAGRGAAGGAADDDGDYAEDGGDESEDEEHEVVMPSAGDASAAAAAARQRPGASGDEDQAIVGADDTYGEDDDDDMEEEEEEGMEDEEADDGDGGMGRDPEASDDLGPGYSGGGSSSGTDGSGDGDESGSGGTGSSGGSGSAGADFEDRGSGQVLYDENDTNDGGAASSTSATPLTIGLLAGTVAMLSSALVVALLRPGPREALRSIIPGLKKYEALDNDDPETGGGGGGGSGGSGGGSAVGGKALGGATGGGSVGGGSAGAGKGAASGVGNGVGNGLSALKTSLAGKGGGSGLPSVAVISMADLSSSKAAATGLLGEATTARSVGLTTPQKLQRTNSNTAAAAAAAMAEELAAMQGHLTPRGSAASMSQLAVGAQPSSARLGPSRGPSTPTRMQLP